MSSLAAHIHKLYVLTLRVDLPSRFTDAKLACLRRALRGHTAAVQDELVDLFDDRHELCDLLLHVNGSLVTAESDGGSPGVKRARADGSSPRRAASESESESSPWSLATDECERLRYANCDEDAEREPAVYAGLDYVRSKDPSCPPIPLLGPAFTFGDASAPLALRRSLSPAPASPNLSGWPGADPPRQKAVRAPPRGDGQRGRTRGSDDGWPDAWPSLPPHLFGARSDRSDRSDRSASPRSHGSDPPEPQFSRALQRDVLRDEVGAIDARIDALHVALSEAIYADRQFARAQDRVAEAERVVL